MCVIHRVTVSQCKKSIHLQLISSRTGLHLALSMEAAPPVQIQSTVQRIARLPIVILTKRNQPSGKHSQEQSSLRLSYPRTVVRNVERLQNSAKANPVHKPPLPSSTAVRPEGVRRHNCLLHHPIYSIVVYLISCSRICIVLVQNEDV